MDSIKYAGILMIILGFIFMCFPIFSSVVFSMLVGIGLILLGLSTIVLGLDIRHESGTLSALLILIGIIGIVIGVLFAIYIDAVSILVSLEFYIVGLFLLVVGISGLIINEDTKSKVMAFLILILGVVSFLIAVFALAQPLYIAILVGIVLILEGIIMILE